MRQLDNEMRQSSVFLSLLFLIQWTNLLVSKVVTPKPEGSKGDNVSFLLNSFQAGYDRRVRPNYGSIPVTVGVTLYILSIGDLSEKFMDFTFDMYFRQFWSDPRLAFDGPKFGIEKLVVGAEYISQIWVPDTFFVNEKIALFHSATTENQFLRIMQNGDVLRSIRLTIKATCLMNLANFPMDDQLCTVEIESFGYTMSDLKYKWNDGLRSVQMSPDVSLPQFLVVGHRQRLVEVSLSSGNYSRLLADVQFARSMGYYMIQVYIPSSLIVVMSWVSFWLNRGAAPARVSLGVTTVLTMTTLINSVNAALPKISYMKSIDIYLFVCFFMVFGALIEYACVGYTDKRIQLRKTRFFATQKKMEERRQLVALQMRMEPGESREYLLPNPSNGGSRETLLPTSNGDDRRNAGGRGREIILPRPHHNSGGRDRGQGRSPRTMQRQHREVHVQLPHQPPLSSSSNPLTSLVPIPSISQPPPPPPSTVLGMRGSDIDKYSRVVFPVVFLTFHLAYWCSFLSFSGQVPDDIVMLE